MSNNKHLGNLFIKSLNPIQQDWNDFKKLNYGQRLEHVRTGTAFEFVQFRKDFAKRIFVILLNLKNQKKEEFLFAKEIARFFKIINQ
jgi:hypothetical protein